MTDSGRAEFGEGFMILASTLCMAGAFFVPVLFAVALLLRPTFLASQESTIPLKDICSDGWSRYDCNAGIRLCISPDFHSACESNRISCDISLNAHGCRISKWIVPDEWVHDTAHDLGFAAQ